MEGLDHFQSVYGIYSVLIGGKIYSNREIPFKNNRPSLRGYFKKKNQELEPETKRC